MKQVFLKPGELYYSKEPTLITTVLGSCVSVCIYDKKNKCGGINHYLLPRKVDKTNSQPEDEPNKYAEQAIKNLLQGMKNELGSSKRDLEIKVLGGSSITEKVNQKINIGSTNIEEAYVILKSFGLKVHSDHTGGLLGRKIQFNTLTGEVKFKYIKKQKNEVVENKQIKVLLIDDSRAARNILKKIIEKDKEFIIAAEAGTINEAEHIRNKIKPDVIALDVNIPNTNVIAYLRQYMRADPVPTIMIADYNLTTSSLIFEALENGAFDYIQKPSFGNADNNHEIYEKLRMAYSSGKINLSKVDKQVFTAKACEANKILDDKIEKSLIVLGASTGGTEAIKDILVCLPKAIPPILIVQHIPPVFSKAFADRLDQLCEFHVKEAEQGDMVKSGNVYVAPGGKHMRVLELDLGLKIEITNDPPVNKFRPSVDYLFNSACKIRRKFMLGVLLTGMGCDGAEGLLALRNMGCETIAQNEASSIVFGMPKVAIERGGAKHVVALDQIARKLCDIINSGSRIKKAA